MSQTKISSFDVSWPDLPLISEWQDTFDSLHLWTQIIGKIKLESMPWTNHSWHTTFQVSTRGLTTGLIPHLLGGFEIEFNFVGHRLEVSRANGQEVSFALEPMSVADFYAKTMESLQKLGLEIKINPKPVEIPDPIQTFTENTAIAPYDSGCVHRLWVAFVNIHRVFTHFRAGFLGKASPVQFFWGSFDMAVTRFSGRRAPKHPGGAPNCADWVMEEAYCWELSSAGFWPGAGLGEAAFYAYAYPEPSAFRSAKIKPEEAYFHKDLGEYILPYKTVKNASNPDEILLDFLQSTYEAAAENGNWDRDDLEMEREAIVP